MVFDNTLGTRIDQLWVPLLTHYRHSSSGLTIDPDRMMAHLDAIRPSVRQFLLAGSTGDGWEMSDSQFLDLLRLSRRRDAFAGCRLLFGVLRPTTEAVVARARLVERGLVEDGQPAGEYVGLAVCPPIEVDASQNLILEHYRAVLAATSSPIAVYQLPQVTGCTIAPETMRTLAANPRITMFKDTSGGDGVAQSGMVSGVLMVRGAEGGYLDALKPTGGYDGWLLSTANVFGPILRRMLVLHSQGKGARAAELSEIMTVIIKSLFREASTLSFGNPFSNANRAADHILAAGRSWRSKPRPITISGNELPLDFLEAVEDVIGYLPLVSALGYLE